VSASNTHVVLDRAAEVEAEIRSDPINVRCLSLTFGQYTIEVSCEARGGFDRMMEALGSVVDEHREGERRWKAALRDNGCKEVSVPA
jgi:hypothetical protein